MTARRRVRYDSASQAAKLTDQVTPSGVPSEPETIQEQMARHGRQEEATRRRERAGAERRRRERGCGCCRG